LRIHDSYDWVSCRNASKLRYVLCNAEKGPGVLWTHMLKQTRFVIGVYVYCRYAGGRTKGIFVREGYPLAVRRLNWALDAEEKGYLGSNYWAGL
jgi:NADH:ubiquinone oxidoreductase subunit F (NADH-binding)